MPPFCRPAASVLLVLAAGMLLAALPGCGSSGTPLDTYRERLADRPQYAVTLENMKMDGDLFGDYYHQYSILEAQRGSDGQLAFDRRTTGWKKVSEDFYRRHREDLGMTLLAKGPDGNLITEPQPAGYQYVGDEQYGQWVTGEDGEDTWEFGGGLLTGVILAEVIDEAGDLAKIKRRHYRNYRQARQRGRSYRGNGRYGTSGSVTRASNPGFYERMRRQRARAQRARRSTGSTSRSRSSGWGK